MEGNNLYFIFSIPKGGDSATFNSCRIIEEGTLWSSDFSFLLTMSTLSLLVEVILVSRKKKN